MAGSRRTPIDRSPRPIIDAEAVKMFRRGERLIAEGRTDEREYQKISTLLHRKLMLKPWHENVLDIDDAPPDAPHNIALWKHVMGLRQQLLALARPRLVTKVDDVGKGDISHAEPPR